MAKQHLLLAAVLTAHILLAAAEADPAYAKLDRNGLFRGLLPQGVKSTGDQGEGVLDVTLPGECSFSVTDYGRTYRFRYARHVGGEIINRSISRVYGIKMALGPMWYDVSEMRFNGEWLKVDLPVSTQWFSPIAFSQSPRCDWS